MNKLPPLFFAWFPVEQKPYELIYFNLLQRRTFEEETEFIGKIKKDSTLSPIDKYCQNLYSAKSNQEVPLSELTTTIKDLFFTPKQQPIFFDQNNRTGMALQDEFWVCTERFFWSYPLLNQGSSRHLLLKNVQLKGSGRNQLAFRPDRTHSWGGQYLWEGLKALAFTQTYEKFLPLGLMDTISIALEKNEYQDSTNDFSFINCTTMRKQTSPRVVQVMGSFDPYSDQKKEIYQDYWKRKMDTSLYPDHFFFQYALMLLTGITDLNITKDNVMLDGSLVDYEDVSYFGDQQQQIFKLKITGPSGIKTIDELIKLGKLYTSSLHFYLDALSITEQGRNKFFDTPIDDQLNQKFIDFISQMDGKVFNLPNFYLDFLKQLVKLQTSYKQGLSYDHKYADSTDSLLKIITTFNPLITSEDKVHELESIYNVEITLDRLEWVNPLLKNYYDSISVTSISKLTAPLLRILTLYTQERKELEKNEVYDLSSKINQSLAQNAWLCPYSYIDKEFRLNQESNLLSYISKTLQGIGINTKDIKEVDLYNFHQTLKLTIDEAVILKGNFILKGIIINNDDLKNHYLKVGPVLFFHD